MHGVRARRVYCACYACNVIGPVRGRVLLCGVCSPGVLGVWVNVFCMCWARCVCVCACVRRVCDICVWLVCGVRVICVWYVCGMCVGCVWYVCSLCVICVRSVCGMCAVGDHIVKL